MPEFGWSFRLGALSAGKLSLYQKYYGVYSFVLFRGEELTPVELRQKTFHTKYVAKTRNKCDRVETVIASI